MKQNERLLVYAVTGFLAVILVIAVVFGPSGREVIGATKPTAPPAKGLGDLLGQKGDGAHVDGQPKAPANPAHPGADNGGGARNGSDVLPAPGEVTKQQPLVAVDPAVLTADLLSQQLGASQRDRMVRMVRARAGDSLEALVRRWCGARDPFLDEAKALNEELTVLHVGQEVCVPWVDDAVVLAAIEASQPKTLMPSGGSIPGVGSLQNVLGGGATPNGNGAAAKPTFAEPGRIAAGGGTGTGGAANGGAANGGTAARAATQYTVKGGDSLWKIADRTYGRQNAARMVREILAANPGLDESLKVGQKLVLPAAN